MLNAVFKILYHTKDFILLEDVGPWDKYSTITNNIEYVLSYLVSGRYLEDRPKLVYYDSSRLLIRVIYKGYKFQAFEDVTLQQLESYYCDSVQDDTNKKIKNRFEPIVEDD